jgi:hypothetical protein
MKCKEGTDKLIEVDLKNFQSIVKQPPHSIQ